MAINYEYNLSLFLKKNLTICKKAINEKAKQNDSPIIPEETRAYKTPFEAV